MVCLFVWQLALDSPLLGICTMKMSAENALMWMKGKEEEIVKLNDKINCYIGNILNYLKLFKYV